MRANKGEITITDDTVCEGHTYNQCSIIIRTAKPRLDNVIFKECKINVDIPINLIGARIVDTQFYDCQFSNGALHQLAAAILYSQAYEERRQLLDTHTTFIAKASIALAVQHFIGSCWLDFLAVKHPHRAWAITVLRNAFPAEHHLSGAGERQ